jgi:molybdate transport system substrate-binding protein
VTLLRSLSLATLLGALPAPAAELTIGAAASLRDALTEVGQAFEAMPPKTKIAFNFAASSAIVQQIINGAAIDVFVAADQASMNRVSKLIDPATRQDVLAGELVLIVNAAHGTTIKSLSDLTRPDVKAIAVCDDAVPGGHYARAWLTKRGLMTALAPRIVKPENVRSALALVASGTATAGFVYATDALMEKDRVRIADRATAADGVDVRYPVAVVARSKWATDATRFVTFLRGDAARAVFSKYGFSPL